MSPQISAVINTYNEEANIERCLECLAGYVDEIVISDMHSTDRTVEICRAFTDRIFFQPKVLLSQAVREHGVAEARHDWIFILDADETVQPELFDELRAIAAHGEYEIVGINRANHFLGYDFTEKGFPWESVERFYRKGTLKFIDHPHRWGEFSGRITTLPPKPEWVITHRTNHTVFQFVQKLNDYTEYEARSLAELGLKANAVRLFLRPLRMFWQHYVTYRGYRNGKAGLVFACIWMTYWHIAALKLWRLETFHLPPGERL